VEGITNAPEAFLSHPITATVSPTTLYVKGSPKANEGTKAMQRRTRLISRMSFIMPLKAEYYQSRGKIARGVTNPVLAAKAQLQTALAAGKVEIIRFFNWGIG
jgi:hypothetical protein